MSTKIVKKIVENEEEVVWELSSQVAELASEAIERHGIFNVGLSGGSMAKFLCEGLPSINSNWSKWKIFFCDERMVPESHQDSTLGLYLEGLTTSIPALTQQFVKVDSSLEAKDAARDYENKLRNLFPGVHWPSFDLLLLGMGPDGHTASLFPGHELMNEDKLWIASITDSPKPPPARVTMTLPVINHAKVCMFAVAGQSKADIVKKVLADHENLPSAKVQPEDGILIWILDKAAAAKL